MKHYRLVPFLIVTLSLGVLPLRADEPKPSTPALISGRTFKDWLADLDDKDLLVREEAVEILAQMGKSAKSAVPKLRTFLKSENRSLRSRSAVALWRITGEAELVSGVLVDDLKDDNAVVRMEALQNLTQMGPAALKMDVALISLLDDADYTIRNAANTYFSQMGVLGQKSLLTALDHKENRIRRNAVTTLLNYHGASVGPATIPLLVKKLKDEDTQVRTSSARLLWLLKQQEGPVLDVLFASVKSGDPETQSGVLSTLANSSERPKSLLPLLKIALKSKNQATVVQAARLTYGVEKKAETVLPLYIAVLKDSNRANWEMAITGIGELGQEGKTALPRLIEILKIPDFYTPYSIRTTLVAIGPTAVPPLIDLVKDTKPITGRYGVSPGETAVQILGQMGNPAAVAVIPLLSDKDHLVRQRAVRVVAMLQGHAKAAVPKLVELLEDSDPNVRIQSVYALQNLGTVAKPALPKLIELAQSKDINLRINCFRALTMIGPDAKDAVPLCMTSFKESNPTIRQVALELLIRVDAGHKEIFNQVMPLLETSNTRYMGLSVLSRMGNDKIKALPVVVKCLEDPNLYLRRQAVDVLAASGEPAKAATKQVLAQLKANESGLQASTLNAIRAMKIDAASAVPALIDYIKIHKDYNIQTAVILLGEYGKEAISAFPALKQVASDSTHQINIRSAAGFAMIQVDKERAQKEPRKLFTDLLAMDRSSFNLARGMLMMDPEDKEAVRVFEDALHNTYYYSRSQACAVLGLLGPQAKRFVPKIRELLKDSHYYVRSSAAFGLWKITKETKEPLKILLANLVDPSQNYIRSQAAYFLGEMGDSAREVLPDLKKALEDKDSYVRTQAETAIKKIEKAVSEPKKP